MSLDLSQYLSMKARDAAEEECSRLRAEVARLKERDEASAKRFCAMLTTGVCDLPDELAREKARAQSAEAERDALREAARRFVNTRSPLSEVQAAFDSLRALIEKENGDAVDGV